MFPREVALMLKVKATGQRSNSVVELLDWYELPSELILILERPQPCLDLYDYLDTKSGIMYERKGQVGCCWTATQDFTGKVYVLIKKTKQLCLDGISIT